MQLKLVECDKWPEWISRGRVRRAGVEARLAGFSLQDVGDRVLTKTGHTIGEFVECCRIGEDANLVIAGKGSTPVAVALLRSLLAAVPDFDAHYVRIPQQSRPLKQHYADPKRYEHPLNPLMEVGLLVMVETSIFKTDWFDEELRDLVYSRYLDNRPTVLATESNEANIVATHYFRTTVPVCLTQ